jgi:hypothetical protein
LLAPRPTPKLDDHPFSAVRHCLLNVFAATLHNWKPFLHPQPEDAPCLGDRDPLKTQQLRPLLYTCQQRYPYANPPCYTSRKRYCYTNPSCYINAGAIYFVCLVQNETPKIFVEPNNWLSAFLSACNYPQLLYVWYLIPFVLSRILINLLKPSGNFTYDQV